MPVVKGKQGLRQYAVGEGRVEARAYSKAVRRCDSPNEWKETALSPPIRRRGRNKCGRNQPSVPSQQEGEGGDGCWWPAWEELVGEGVLSLGRNEG